MFRSVFFSRAATGSFLLVLASLSSSASHGQTSEAPSKQALGALEPLRYGDDSLVVDLGVGLWAWPLPMDWDGDGDIDLVISCPDVPQNGTFFFENPARPGEVDGDEGGEKLPVFRPGVKVGPALRNVQVSYVNGKPRVLTPGVERSFGPGGFQEQGRPLPASAKVPASGMKLRANQWRYVDYDGDGDSDLIVGIEDWSDYGWDDAYDDQGRWTNGPLHGYVFLLTNVGSEAAPEYADATKLLADGQPIDTYGMPSPSFADFDGDGDLDLICGEFLDGFTYFANEGTREKPSYAAGVRLKDEAGKPLAMNVQMITPTAFDWDRDGDVDLIVGDEDGRVALVEHAGKVDDGVPVFLPPVYFQQQAREVKFGALVTPVSVDWDRDGDEDLICGNTAGHIGWIENLGLAESASVGDPPKWAPPKLLETGGKTLRIQAGDNGSIQGPAEAKWGYTVLDVADWDDDGALDLIVNSIHGRIEWYRGTGSPPTLAEAQPVEVAWPGEPPRPEWNWKRPAPGELVTQWRTSPIATDLDADGLVDLVVLDHEGYLAWFRRFRDETSGKLLLAPGERVFLSERGEPLRLNDQRAGKSGRRKLCLVDYDGDGKRDLILNDANARLLRNITADDATGVAMRFEDAGPLADRKLAGHTTCPTTVDWDGDGRRDVLLGGEDGGLYLVRRGAKGRASE
ncbi:MAG TPA: VCBS repeat-containing protein [Pirellulaceae bacterium]|nr:VCBS repeat-containing protein [Pirellulaceae bacterium]